MRQARGNRLRGEGGSHTPTVEEARKWSLFHATPLPKKPKPIPQTPLPSAGPGTPWKTPKFEFNTPQRKLKLGKTKEFAMNVRKGEFKEWLTFLKKNGLGTTALRRELNENLAFPTDVILLQHEKMVKGRGSGFDILVKCFSHQGFTTHYKILAPVLKSLPPLKFRQGEIEGIDINSVRQQADGCCRFCRGYSWAGKVDVREVDKGADVPCQSLHRSVVPYTAEETAQFARHKYELLFRRWCRESRYDWIFETPKLSDWEIPRDDPRLRHITMLKQQHTVTAGAPKMYNGDLVAGYNQRREELTKQDVAAKILIDAVRLENPQLAATYASMDLERKRRQVRTDWLCVKQVKVARKEAGQKRKAPATAAPAPAASAAPAAPATAAAATRGDSGGPAKRRKQQHHHQPRDSGSGSEAQVKRVKFAREPEGPTLQGQKTPAKSILKKTNPRTANTQNTSASRKAKRIRITVTANAAAAAVAAAAAPEKNSKDVPKKYDGGLPSSFDPVIIRQQYNSGVASATGFWDGMAPFGYPSAEAHGSLVSSCVT